MIDSLTKRNGCITFGILPSVLWLLLLSATWMASTPSATAFPFLGGAAIQPVFRVPYPFRQIVSPLLQPLPRRPMIRMLHQQQYYRRYHQILRRRYRQRVRQRYQRHVRPMIRRTIARPTFHLARPINHRILTYRVNRNPNHRVGG